MVDASPFVLIIDDDDQASLTEELDLMEIPNVYRHPQRLTFSDLERATLILIDEFLEQWPEREEFADTPALYVRDGIGLAAIIRSHLDGRGSLLHTNPSPSRTAIALRTGDLNRLAAGIPHSMRAISVATRHDLEWVFEKQDSDPSEFVSLAAAAADLPSVWDPQDPSEQLAWLDLSPDQSWYSRAFAQIERCRPPWTQLSQANAGRPWLAWFLQRILPYSTFLVDDARAAALLGITAESFEAVVCDESELSDRLAARKYTGHLRDVSGRRWWRAGIQELRDLLTRTASSDRSVDLAAAASAMADTPLKALLVDDPVFVIDEDHRVTPQPISAQDAVRLQPDGWPVYADPAWLAAEDARADSSLRGLVVLDDRPFLDGE